MKDQDQAKRDKNKNILMFQNNDMNKCQQNQFSIKIKIKDQRNKLQD